MSEIKDWVLVTPEKLKQIDPGQKKRPLEQNMIDEGFYMVGPFIVEGPKNPQAKNELYTNLRFTQEDDKHFVYYGSTNLVHRFEVKGRIRFTNNKLKMFTDIWGEQTIRAITPQDAHRFNAKFKKTPTVEELVNAFWPDPED